jgi:hypothetical protein
MLTEEQRAIRNARRRAARLENPEKYRQHKRDHYWRDPKARSAYVAAWWRAHPLKKVEYNLKRKFGITIAQWEAIFEKQGRCCASCGALTANTKKGWHTDHYPGTREIRGILCHHCNVILGMCGENMDLLRGVIKYWEAKPQPLTFL